MTLIQLSRKLSSDKKKEGISGIKTICCIRNCKVMYVTFIIRYTLGCLELYLN